MKKRRILITIIELNVYYSHQTLWKQTWGGESGTRGRGGSGGILFQVVILTGRPSACLSFVYMHDVLIELQTLGLQEESYVT